jgi:hypothetical protein
MNFWYVHCISGSATGCFNYLHIRLRQEFRMEEPKKGSKFMQTSATSQLVLSCLFRCVISAPDLLLRLTFVKLLTIICLSSPNYVFSSNHHKYTTRVLSSKSTCDAHPSLRLNVWMFLSASGIQNTRDQSELTQTSATSQHLLSCFWIIYYFLHRLIRRGWRNSQLTWSSRDVAAATCS